MSKVFTQSQIASALALMLGAWGAFPAFENYSENSREAKARQEKVNADIKAAEQREYDRNFESDLALFRIKGNCIIAHSVESNTPANSIKVGSSARMVNLNGTPLEPGLDVCARDGSTAVTARNLGDIIFADHADVAQADHEEYLTYYEKKLNAQRGVK